MIVERLAKSGLVFWVDQSVVDDASLVELVEQDNLRQSWLVIDLVMIANVEGRSYFEVPIPNIETRLAIIRGDLNLVWASAQGWGRRRFKIFGPLRDAQSIAALDQHRLGSTFRLLPNDTKHAVRRAVEYGTRTYGGSRIKKRSACVVTYANDSGGWFDVFYRHYCDQLGAGTSIYVVTPRPESFVDYVLGGVVGLSGFPYDDVARSQLFSGVSAGLMAYYEWVIVADVDELVLPHPAGPYQTIRERLANPHGLREINFSLGVDLVHHDGEPVYTASELPLAQRRYGVPNSGMCKPHVCRVSTVLDIGFHYCQQAPSIPADDSGFLMLHLKYACQRRREDVAQLVANTDYTDPLIRTYSYSSVAERLRHPMLSQVSTSDAVSFWSWDVAEFQREIERSVVYSGERDLFIGRNFAYPVVLDFSPG